MQNVIFKHDDYITVQLSRCVSYHTREKFTEITNTLNFSNEKEQMRRGLIDLYI